jgi:hypothetical protein
MIDDIIEFVDNEDEEGVIILVLSFTFNNISVMSLVADSFHGGGNRSMRRTPPTCCKSPTSFITQCCVKYTSP